MPNSLSRSSQHRLRLPSRLADVLRLVGTVLCALTLTASLASAQTIEVESVVLRLIDEADLAAGESGIVIELNVSEGQGVKRGDVIARIDDTAARIAEQTARAELALAKAKAENDVAVRAAQTAQRVAEAELARSQESIARFPKSVSQSQIDVERLSIDKLKLEVEAGKQEQHLASLAQQVAERKLEAAQLEINRRKIVSPIDAMVVEVEAAVGEWVEPGQKVVRLVSTQRLKAEGFVSASEAARDLSGATAVVQLDNGQTVTGRVAFVSPEIDPINKQVRIWAELDNSDGKLRPGQPVQMTLKNED
ncbi:HlyD family efflux transporter periplasmic adaptor subunit [Aeoliella sp. ICT_H6.2]|uniref:HlyD family efflux transporter periplasmic adaptor subunit n=1 Tax=Aeoliella straminimaris TaxID=2954799 RepID=A0A9X2FCQ5_9BACT|nr:HlyD family efflux transporter periplasmic adaptor subunit [Aeoliella straminimaris]MCO6046164.1 HlyD family efflux transporter periplasmic adaptor subunit [Aeoliella straminimaris]